MLTTVGYLTVVTELRVHYKFVTLENFYFLICENWTLDITEYLCVELIWWPKYVLATDYPPTADAGSNVIISLPQKSVTLYGNSSTDDKKIVSYEWTRTSDDKLAVDMVVSGTRFL